ncbi:hypothetical protein [Aeromonas tecta]|uniref:hypothetical protein n=1 Tax=Aeromonas tecta TaxID=324617 RepID=UPI00067FC392|nr:hypothetical protein [Aeromonas tecta]
MLPLWIFTEGDKARGLGHLSRCSAYASAWQQLGGAVHWVVDGDALARDRLKDQKVSWTSWQHNDIPPQQAVAIVDSYSASLTTLESISAGFVRVIYLDDTKRLPYPAGLVIHASPGTPGHPQGAARWQWGPAWQPLRPPFWSVPARTRISARIERILIIMGGTDIRDLTPRLVTWLHGQYPGIELEVVTAAPDPRLSHCHQHHGLDAEQMTDLMSRCDLAISSAGQVTYELARCGLPGLLIGVADNQAEQLAGWCGPDGFVCGGWWHEDELFTRLTQGMALLGQDERARRVSELQARMSGNGTLEALTWLNRP